MPASYVLRIDPWAPEYESSIQLAGDQEPAPVDTRVETSSWSPIRPSPAPRPVIAFVDGVRRIERRLHVEHGGTIAPGLLGSLGVGAVVVDSRARVAETSVRRAAVVGGGLRIEPFRATVPGAGATLVFEPLSEPDSTPQAPLDGLQKAMRKAEAELASSLSGQVEVVFQDGPLSFATGSPCGLVGLVKRLQRAYLERDAQELLPRLETGERTPLFLIGGQQPRYSWYLRIAFGRAIESALTGVVRLETRAEAGVDEARRLADLSAREIPRFASHAARDPRAPQNLYPVGGLESRLKHLLGDPAVVGRAVEAQLHSEVTA